MPVDASLRNMMDAIDDHAQDMGSGAYCLLARHLKEVSDSIATKELDAKRSLAEAMIVEHPACIGTCAVYNYTHDARFMQSMVRTKAIELQAYDQPCAAVLGCKWKLQLARSLLDFDGDPEMLVRVRLGVKSLLVARSGFLDQITQVLDEIGVTPRMLCPYDLAEAPIEGDSGEGPKARNFLHYEPRMLRWLLERSPRSPWPVLGTIATQPHCVYRLIQRANFEGGDNPKINRPCKCPNCQGVPMPALPEQSVSLTPSDNESESSDPPVTRRRAAEARTRARANAASPYQRP